MARCRRNRRLAGGLARRFWTPGGKRPDLGECKDRMPWDTYWTRVALAQTVSLESGRAVPQNALTWVPDASVL